MKIQFSFSIFLIILLLVFPFSGCKTYVVASPNLDGTVHVTNNNCFLFNNHIRFNYYEKFQSTDLRYFIFDKSRSVVIDHNTQPITIHHGLNQININVNSIVNGSDTFTLEIENPKGSKTVIRFQ